MNKFIHIPELHMSDEQLSNTLRMQGYDLINLEKMEKGGTIAHNQGEAGGYLVGKRHSEGGIKAVNKSTGQLLEMEGGEVVITRDAVSDDEKREFEGEMLTNREILSRINESGGGIAFDKGGEVQKMDVGGEISTFQALIKSLNITAPKNMAAVLYYEMWEKVTYPFFTQYVMSPPVKNRFSQENKNAKFKKGQRVFFVGGIPAFGTITNARSTQTCDILSNGTTYTIERKYIFSNPNVFRIISNKFYYYNQDCNLPLNINNLLNSSSNTVNVRYSTSDKYVTVYYDELDNYIQNNAGTFDYYISDDSSVIVQLGVFSAQIKVSGLSFKEYVIALYDNLYTPFSIYINACILREYEKSENRKYLVNYTDIAISVGKDPIKGNFNLTTQVATFKDAMEWLTTFKINNDDKILIKIFWENDKSLEYQLSGEIYNSPYYDKSMVAPANASGLLSLPIRIAYETGWMIGATKPQGDALVDTNIDGDYSFYSFGFENTTNINYGVNKPILKPSSNLEYAPSQTASLEPSKTYSIIANYNDTVREEISTLYFILNNTPTYEFETRISLIQEIEKLNKVVHVVDDIAYVSDNIIDELLDADTYPNPNRPSRVPTQGFFQPNGEPTKLTSFQIKMAQRNDFAAWFGVYNQAYTYNKLFPNEPIPCSKVVTEGGEPLVVYMGVGREFEAVRFNRFPIAYFAVNYDYAVWFAETKNQDGGWVLPFFLDIKNPLDLTLFGINKVPAKDFYDWLFLQTGMTHKELGFVGAWEDPNIPPMEVWMYIRNNQAFLQILKDSMIVDGIHFYENNPANDPNSSNYKTEVWSTFYPNQSKLASPERGQYVLSSVDSFKMKKGGKLL